MNYKITVNNYKDDKYYPKIVNAVNELLGSNDTVTTAKVMQKIGVLSIENYHKWEKGKVPYLEKVITCNLSKANRILRIIGFHAHDLNMAKRIKFLKYKKKTLRFTKSGYKKGEELYAREYVVVAKRAVKQIKS